MITPITNIYHSKKCFVLVLLVVVFVTILAFGYFNEKGKTLLKAINNDDLQAVQKLLEKNPELVNTLIQRKGKRPDTYPLNYAIANKHKDIAKFLITKGADPDAVVDGAPRPRRRRRPRRRGRRNR